MFVTSPFQNAFFAEIVEALHEALFDIGAEVVVTSEPDAHDVLDDDVFVLVPHHEYVALEGPAIVDDEAVARRTIGISAEQPGEEFFGANATIGARLGAVLDFSPLAVAAYRRAGIDAQHLPFGYVPSWDRFDRSSAAAWASGRDTPALFLGSRKTRRLSILAEAADSLVRHDARLIVSDNDEPNPGGSRAFVAGDAKRDLLASTRVLVNIHQGDEPYFEWLRFADAAHCGAVVLSEPSTGSEPFAPGEHFLTFDRGELGRQLDRVVGDDRLLSETAEHAYATLRSMPLREGVQVLIETARTLLDSPPPPALPPRTRAEQVGRARVDPLPRRSWTPYADRPLARLTRRRAEPEPMLIAPPGTRLRTAVTDLWQARGGAPAVGLVADGLDAEGRPMLEGQWPWQPWRLLHGQHLGRVMLVDPRLDREAGRWARSVERDAGAFTRYRHLVIQVFAAAHGISLGHVACPVAELHGVAADPSQQLPEPIAHAVRAVLDRNG